MVKSLEAAKRKMKDRVSTAASYLQEGLGEAPDPIDILLKNPDASAKKLADGVNQSIKSGKYKQGLEKAKKRGSWRDSHERAGAHYAERADDMSEHAMEDYPARAAAIKRCQDAIADMPKATFVQREARGAKYRQLYHEEMNKLYGRKD
jgi:hypothetical protein